MHVSRSFGVRAGRAARVKLRGAASRPLLRAGSSVGVLVAIFSLSLFAASAGASFGELAKVGAFGVGAGEFYFPTGLAVDPETNDVFVVDEPGSEWPGIGPSSFRIQEFSPSLGKPIATVTVPTPKIGEHGYQFVAGIAVDPSSKRLYVLKSINAEESGYTYVAGEIDIYSTDVSSETLKSEGVLYKFATSLPAPDTVSEPVGLAVDPVNHDVIVLGASSDGENAHIQEVSSTGQLGSSYEDSSHNLGKIGSMPTGIAVGPDGSFYFTVNFNAVEKKVLRPGVVKLSPDLSTMTVVHQVRGEEPGLDGGTAGGNGRTYGPQVAVNPEGTVVYAAEESVGSSLKEAGVYEVRGMSVSTGEQSVVYGGGKTTCEIASAYSAIAAGSDGVVYALDEGGGNSSEPSPYGFHLVEFGPGGSGCPAPATSFTVDGKPEAVGGASVEVMKGEDVKLVASEAELNSEKPSELVWEVSGPESVTEKVTPVPPATTASVELSHRFLKPGVYTVSLSMAVSPGTLGSPPVVTRKIDVTAPSPVATFEVFGAGGLLAQSVKPGEEVTFDGSASSDPTGECTPSAGCVPTSHLKSYTWNFGDGSQAVTSTEPKVKHVFANAGLQEVSDTVSLTVTNEEGVESTPNVQAVTVLGTQEEVKQTPAKEVFKEAPKEAVKESPPGKSQVVPPPSRKPLTTAQKLALALKACKKYKSKKARAVCERAAHKKYAPPKKHTKKKKKKG